MDAVVTAGLGRGFEVVTWPIVQRQGTSGEWTGDVWIATLRYERAGRVGVRVDGGLIASPVGLANLTVRRPHLNPTISSPSSLFTALPLLELRGPRTNLLGAIYPFGGQVTVSGTRWDARAALIDTSPLRRRDILSSENPPRFRNMVVGGGITPVVGLRFGASVTRGGWARAGESPAVTEDRDATIVTAETEFSFAFTKLGAEWVRDAIETSSGRHVAYRMVRAGSADAGPALVRGSACRTHGRTAGVACGDHPAATDEHRRSTRVPADARSHPARRPSRAPQLRRVPDSITRWRCPWSGGSAGSEWDRACTDRRCTSRCRPARPTPSSSRCAPVACSSASLPAPVSPAWRR